MTKPHQGWAWGMGVGWTQLRAWVSHEDWQALGSQLLTCPACCPPTDVSRSPCWLAVMGPGGGAPMSAPVSNAPLWGCSSGH